MTYFLTFFLVDDVLDLLGVFDIFGGFFVIAGIFFIQVVNLPIADIFLYILNNKLPVITKKIIQRKSF